MNNQQNQFKANINWEGSHKFIKLYGKTSKNGTFYLMGDFGRQFKIVIKETTGQYAKEGEWQAELIPVNYVKMDAQGQNQQQRYPNTPKPQNIPVKPSQTPSGGIQFSDGYEPDDEIGF